MILIYLTACLISFPFNLFCFFNFTHLATHARTLRSALFQRYLFVYIYSKEIKTINFITAHKAVNDLKWKKRRLIPIHSLKAYCTAEWENNSAKCIIQVLCLVGCRDKRWQESVSAHEKLFTSIVCKANESVRHHRENNFFIKDLIVCYRYICYKQRRHLHLFLFT